MSWRTWSSVEEKRERPCRPGDRCRVWACCPCRPGDRYRVWACCPCRPGVCVSVVGHSHFVSFRRQITISQYVGLWLCKGLCMAVCVSCLFQGSKGFESNLISCPRHLLCRVHGTGSGQGLKSLRLSTHTHKRRHTLTHTHTLTNAHTHTCAHTHTHTLPNAHTHSHMHTQTHSQTQSRTHTRTHTHTHVHTHTHSHRHTQKHIHALTQTHTYTLTHT